MNILIIRYLVLKILYYILKKGNKIYKNSLIFFKYNIISKYNCIDFH